MSTKQTAPQTIDAYIAAFPQDVQGILETIRAIIKEAVPDAEETISYAMPGFTLKGQYLVYVGAYKKHIGMYPVPVGDAEFNAALSAYIAGKGTVRFPFDQPMPFDLIRRMVELLAQATMERAVAKGKKK